MPAQQAFFDPNKGGAKYPAAAIPGGWSPFPCPLAPRLLPRAHPHPGRRRPRHAAAEPPPAAG
jgi:hypothetical protein